ncbi:UNVERIFIED_CONTAM: hypothetical protein HDU68_008261 [Siphonaria sp. JEL0065]|nr:hypothetical protein HDU68_008261 [Siphonaria sp. JEL0065]
MPTIVLESPFTERSVSFESVDGFVIHGTLTYPSPTGHQNKPTPYVVIVQGSGKLDRDGNSKQISLEVYSRLAQFLASIGVSSVRYDKRGTHASLCPPPSYKGKNKKDIFNTSGLDDLAADAVAALKFGSTLPQVDTTKLFVAGHSEGGIIMGRICKTAAQTHPEISLKGVMILCGFGETIVDAIESQTRKAIRDLDSGGFFQRNIVKPLVVNTGIMSTDSLKEFILDPKKKDLESTTYWLMPFPLKYFRDHYTLDLEEEGKWIKCPVLIVGGGKDFQVDAGKCTRENADRLLVNARKVDIEVLPNMTHVLRDTEGGVVSMLEVQSFYAQQAKEELSPGLLKALEKFISS